MELTNQLNAPAAAFPTKELPEARREKLLIVLLTPNAGSSGDFVLRATTTEECTCV
jgi:hypothetical protein